MTVERSRGRVLSGRLGTSTTERTAQVGLVGARGDVGDLLSRLPPHPVASSYTPGDLADDAESHYARLAHIVGGRSTPARAGDPDGSERELAGHANVSPAGATHRSPTYATTPVDRIGHIPGQVARIKMTSIGIRALAANVSAVVSDVANTGRPAVVTKHGQPVAALIAIGDLEDLLRARAADADEQVIGAPGDRSPGEHAGLTPAPR
jgi:prevent-host-death family protein